MLRLLEDGDTWSEIYTIDYYEWLTKEMNKTGDGSQPFMTNLQLIMATFGNAGTRLNNAGPNQATTARTDSETAAQKPVGYSRERPAIHELGAVKELPNTNHYTKTQRMMRIVTNNITQFFSWPRGNWRTWATKCGPGNHRRS